MRNHLFAAGAFLVASLAGSRLASAQFSCTTQELPVTDCRRPDASTSCCTELRPSPITMDSNTPCSQSFLWSLAGPQLNASQIAQHNARHMIQTSSFTDWPEAANLGGSTYARHWISALMLAGVDYIPGQSWHSSERDYLQAVRGDRSPYHGRYSHLQVASIGDAAEGDYAIASRRPVLFGPDTIRLSCEHFAATPVQQASILLHEAWHMVYGSHDSPGQDIYWARTKDALLPGNMNGTFVSPASPASRTRQSVYQTQYNFLCDITNTPRRWVPNRTLYQANSTRFDLLKNLSLIDPAECQNRNLGLRPGEPIAGAPPRAVTFRIQGELHRTFAAGDVTIPIDLVYHVFPPSEAGGHTLIDSRNWLVDNELLFRLVATAQFPNNQSDEDAETVIVYYQAALYSDDGVCRMDTSPLSSGLPLGCPGDEGQQKWAAFELNSITHAPPPRIYSLRTQVNPQACSAGFCDTADFTIYAELDW